MIILHPVLDAIFRAEPEGWQQTSQATASWKHGNGLCVALPSEKIPGDNNTHLKTLIFQIDDRTIPINVPWIQGGASDLPKILNGLDAWIQGLDLVPRRRIAQQVTAWLTLHGQAGIYAVGLDQTVADKVDLYPVQGSLYGTRVRAPEALVQILSPDLAALWALAPIPVSKRDARQWRMLLPQTAHARMETISAMGPELRSVPWPLQNR